MEWNGIQRDSRFSEVIQNLSQEIGIDIEPYYVPSTTTAATQANEELNPKELINQVTAFVAAKGFVYSDDDLKNFYLCLKSKPFVILAGISGTGKTKLVRLFSESIGATKENGRYSQIAVRPDWNDSSDLLGFNDINGKFKPGPLTTVIKGANDNPFKPYIICLDEMNLSRVEYYFSDFLSLIETRDKDGYSDPLFKPEYFMIEEDRQAYKDLRLSPNIYVIGTVNMDETTFPFSKKVLDRANTIEFSSVHLLPKRPDSKVDLAITEVSNTILMASYNLLNDCLVDNYDYITSVVKKLEEVNKILETASLHVGYRVRDEICFYMLYNSQFGLLSEDDAFDYQLMQKILPRIQGSNGVLSGVLIDLFKLAAGKQFSKDNVNVGEEALRYVQEVEKIGPYPRTARKIATMLWRFEDGFTSFWS